jgi:CBS domain-containing protein
MNPALRVRDAMTSHLITVRADANVRGLRALFARYDADVLPVVGRDESGGMRRLAGIVTRADLLQFLLGAKSLKGLERREGEPVSVLVRPARALESGMALSEAAQALLSVRLDALPVIDDSGRVIGVLSLDAVLRRAPYAACAR